VAAVNVPRFVRNWTSDTDPRIERWVELGRVDAVAFASYAQRVASTPPVLSVVADLDELPISELRRLGRVVRVTPGDALRDVNLTDSGYVQH
jgi:hypothetical protein